MGIGQFRWLPSLRELDEEQLSVIHGSLNKGGCLIYGPAGCGKTSISLYCAKTLEDTKKSYIVFLYTDVLKKFILAALDDLDIPHYRVHRFYQWVHNLYMKNIGFPPNPIDDSGNTNFSIWIDKLLEHFSKYKNKIPHYDYIIIDEAQDFPKNVSELLHLMSENLIVAGDSAQSIYENNPSFEIFSENWQPINTKYQLAHNYRNPKTIAKIAALFLDSDSEQFLNSVKGREYEMKPILYLVDDENEYAERIIQVIQNSHGAERIGVLCFKKEQILSLGSIFEKKGIDHQIALRNSDCNFKEPLPTLTTIHSSKGLEFDTVILPYLDKSTWDTEFSRVEEKRKKAFFVALTRAKNKLYLIAPKGNECSFVKNILDTDPDLIQIPKLVGSFSQTQITFDDDPF